MKLVNKVSEKLSLYDKFKTFKCWRALCHISVKFKSANDGDIDLTINRKDFEKASET